MSDAPAGRNPFRCFDGVFLRNSILIALAILALSFVERGFARGSSARIAVGIAQALLMATFVVASMLTLRKLDEFLLRVHLEAIAIAFTASGALFAAYGMVELAGAPSIEWAVWAWPVMALFWGIAVILRNRHYR